jgi:3-methyl-2-oxobutanoate hydroxymethyltransferase
MIRAVTAFAADVRARAFPGPEHAYGIAPEELRELRLLLERQRSGPREQ